MTSGIVEKSNVYHVSGTLLKQQIDEVAMKSVNEEIQAQNHEAVLDHFETDGWEFLTGVQIRMISEAQKMEEAGQPTLFPLEPKDAD